MILSSLLLILSYFLESIVTNIFKNFIPFFTIATIIIVSRINLKEDKKYIFIFIFGIIYDLLYTNLLFIHGFIFMLFYYL